MNTPRIFDQEKLNVYHESLAFVAKATELLERVPKIKSVAPDRVYEEPSEYVAKLPAEQVKVKVQDRSGQI